MTLLHRLASILRWLFHRNRAEQGLHDEVLAFVDMAAADKVCDGVSLTEARRLAVLDLGGVEQTKASAPIATEPCSTMLEQTFDMRSASSPNIQGSCSSSC
jgi:hypothetical protein